MNDAFAHVAGLPGVADAVTSARESVDRLRGHRALRRGGPEVSAESALLGALAIGVAFGCVIAPLSAGVLAYYYRNQGGPAPRDLPSERP